MEYSSGEFERLSVIDDGTRNGYADCRYFLCFDYFFITLISFFIFLLLLFVRIAISELELIFCFVVFNSPCVRFGFRFLLLLPHFSFVGVYRDARLTRVYRGRGTFYFLVVFWVGGRKYLFLCLKKILKIYIFYFKLF